VLQHSFPRTGGVAAHGVIVAGVVEGSLLRVRKLRI
jgi:hypothetical protein